MYVCMYLGVAGLVRILVVARPSVLLVLHCQSCLL